MLATAVIAALALAAPPPPEAPIPREPRALAAALARVTAAVRSAVADWDLRAAPDLRVTLPSLYQQRIVRLLARDEALSRAVIQRLPPALRAHVADDVTVRRELARLTPPLRPGSIRVVRREPAARLRRYYAEAERRFHVPWNVLAAVNFVESDFGRIASASAAGAQGPMQFLPSTWRRYGLGGDVHDSHDAILGSANFLSAAGARTDVARALYRYNPSHAYVDAVQRYARWMRTDRFAYANYYAWQLFVKTTSGDRRLTGPGIR